MSFLLPLMLPHQLPHAIPLQDIVSQQMRILCCTHLQPAGPSFIQDEIPWAALICAWAEAVQDITKHTIKPQKYTLCNHRKRPEVIAFIIPYCSLPNDSKCKRYQEHSCQCLNLSCFWLPCSPQIAFKKQLVFPATSLVILNISLEQFALGPFPQAKKISSFVLTMLSYQLLQLPIRIRAQSYRAINYSHR